MPKERRTHRPHDAGAAEVVRVSVDVADPSTRLAASVVLTAAGNVVVEGVCGDVVITDCGGIESGGGDTILVVPPLARSCAGALELVARGAVRAAVTTREIHVLPMVVQTARANLACFSDEVVRLAMAFPALAERQLEVLLAVAAGGSAEDVARRLHLSVATVKRELSALFTGVGVKSRVELVLRARELGLLEGSDASPS